MKKIGWVFAVLSLFTFGGVALSEEAGQSTIGAASVDLINQIASQLVFELSELEETKLDRITWQCPEGYQPYILPGLDIQVCIGPHPDYPNDSARWRFLFNVDGTTLGFSVRIICDENNECTLRILGPLSMRLTCSITGPTGPDQDIYRVECKKGAFAFNDGEDPNLCIHYHFKRTVSELFVCTKECQESWLDEVCSPAGEIPFAPQLLPNFPGAPEDFEG